MTGSRSRRRTTSLPWARWPTWSASDITAISAYYNVNTHINPTNVCVYKCDFCAFRADLGEDRAYVMDRDQIIERAGQAHARGATELHIVGGLHHKLPFDYYVDVVRWVKEAAPRSTSRRTRPSRSSGSARSPASRSRRCSRT